MVVVVISIFFSNILWAQSLDLSDVAEGDLRSHLRPVFSVVASQNELPAKLGFYNEARKLMLGTSVLDLYHIYDGNVNDYYIPAFWMGFVASPNLTLFMQMSQGKWQNENIMTFGPVINFIWGEEPKENVINVSVNHLNGPDDFRMKDISLSFMKKKEFDFLNIYYGVTAHYVNSRIAPQNSDINKTINENIYHLRTGFYKTFKAIDMGIEVDLTKDAIITKYKLVLII